MVIVTMLPHGGRRATKFYIGIIEVRSSRFTRQICQALPEFIQDWSRSWPNTAFPSSYQLSHSGSELHALVLREVGQQCGPYPDLLILSLGPCQFPVRPRFWV